MRLLATITDEDIFNDVANKDTDGFYERHAARAIVLTDDSKIYLLNMSNHGYHKLPGGGIDKGEAVKAALYRELIEEIGCPAETIAEVGEIVEYRNEMEWKQISHCFLAKQAGELGQTNLEPGEIEEGAQTVIVNNIDEAITLLEQDKPQTYEGKFIQRRDLQFLREAKTLI
jgi:8-oxo-dGTP diphosphatase